jgi:hypothetical protein
MLEAIDLGLGNIGKFLQNYTAPHLMTLIVTAVRSYSLQKEFPTVYQISVFITVLTRGRMELE